MDHQYTIAISFLPNFPKVFAYTDIRTFRGIESGDRIVGTNTETDTLMYGVIRILCCGECAYTGRSNIIHHNYPN